MARTIVIECHPRHQHHLGCRRDHRVADFLHIQAAEATRRELVARTAFADGVPAVAVDEVGIPLETRGPNPVPCCGGVGRAA